MQDFSELSGLVNFLKGQAFPKDLPLSFNLPPRSLVERLLQGIANGNYKTDEEASKDLYGSPPSSPSFLRLKDRLYSKLYQQIFLINFEGNKFSHESQKYYKSLTSLLAAQILLGMGNYMLAKKLAKRIVKYATENNQPEIGFLATNIIKIVIWENPEKRTPVELRRYEKILKLFRTNLLTETEINSCYGTIIQNMQKGGNFRDKDIEQVQKKLKNIASKLDGVSNNKLLRYYFSIAVLEIQKMNYNDAINTCELGLKRTNNTQIPSSQILHLLKTQCHIHLNLFQNALEDIKAAEEKDRKRGHNRFQFHELKFLIYIRSSDFGNAVKIYQDAINNKSFSSLYQIAQESWHQYGLLLLFLIQLDKIPPSESLDKIKPKLRLGKLINELQEYSKDKSGQNLSIRILHTMILLVSKRYEEFEDALPSLQAYIQRYIRKYPELSRSNLLVKMLSEIPKVDYNAERAAWRARTMVAKMTVPPETLPLKITEMEVIPYEKMWQFVVEFLHTIKKRPSAKKRDA